MKSLSVFLFFLSTNFCFGQIYIDQLGLGQSINQIIYQGSINGSGTCPDYDSELSYSQIVPFASGIDLTLEIAQLTGTLTINSNSVSQGTILQLVSGQPNFQFHFTSSGTVSFNVWANGIPTVASQIYPCWIDQLITQPACSNSYTLFPGETFAACSVAMATGISENNVQQKLFFNEENKTLFVETENENELLVTDIFGKIILKENLRKGKHNIVLPILSSGVYIAKMEGRNKPLKFVIR